MNKEEAVKEIVKYYPTYYDVVERLLFLQQENKQLKEENERLNKRLNNLEYEYHCVVGGSDIVFDINEKLKQKIDKAIELIPNIYFRLNISGATMALKLIDSEYGKELLEILKGDTNE